MQTIENLPDEQINNIFVSCFWPTATSTEAQRKQIICWMKTDNITLIDINNYLEDLENSEYSSVYPTQY